MRIFGVIVTLALGIVLLAAPVCAEPKDDIVAKLNEWADAFSAHDVDRILDLYSKDAVVWGTTSPALRTTPAEVRAYFEGAFKIPNLKIRYDNQTIRFFGDVAVAAGNYTFVASSGDQTQSRPARYSLTFIKQGNDWVIVDHNSSPMPPGTRT